MEWLLLAVAVVALITATVAILLESSKPFQPHPGVKDIQRPLKPAQPADIERRKTE